MGEHREEIDDRDFHVSFSEPFHREVYELWIVLRKHKPAYDEEQGDSGKSHVTQRATGINVVE